MRLVEATATDIDELVTLWHNLATEMESYDQLNELDSEDIEEVSQDGFRNHLSNKSITDYLITHTDKTIGFVTLQNETQPSRKHSVSLRVVNLYIEENYRDHGYGTDVVERVKQIACEQDCDILKVSCDWDNKRARRFYRNTAFRPKQVDYVQSVE